MLMQACYVFVVIVTPKTAASGYSVENTAVATWGAASKWSLDSQRHVWLSQRHERMSCLCY